MRTQIVLLVASLGLLLCSSARAAEKVFLPLDVVIDTGGAPLAAWQFEFTYPSGRMEIVGLEGGDPPFSEAPYYDLKGLTAGRVVVAAFTLDPHPPGGRVRVARIHLLEKVDDLPRPTIRLVTAAGPDGKLLHASITLLTQKGDRP